MDDENEVTVGAVVSRVIVALAVAVAAGPVFPEPSVAPFAAKVGATEPSEHPVTVTVRIVLAVSAPGSNEHPVARPAPAEFAKSAEVMPVTASENVIVNVNDVAWVAAACADVNETIEGDVVSTAMLLVSAMFAPAGSVVDVIALPARSLTVPTV